MLLWQNLLKQIEKLKKNKSSYRGSIENSLRTSDLPVSYTWAYQRQSCFKDFKNLLVIKFYQLIQQMNLIILERFTPATGPIAEAQNLAAEAFGAAKHSFY